MSDEIARRTEHTLLGTDDAMIWAQEFCRIFAGHTIVNDDYGGPVQGGIISPGTMVGWFANAMATAINMLPDMADEDEEDTEPHPLEKPFLEGFNEGRPDPVDPE